MPRKKAMTLSAVTTLIVETFLPDTYQKYLFMNYKQSPQYQSYQSFIPDFLQGRPRSVIIHSLERWSKSLKYTQEDVSTVDEDGAFTVKGSHDKAHTVSFGSKSDDPTPSCTCRDWVEWHIPCKHFWAIFRFYPDWNWERLPDSYKASAYLSSDTGALDNFFNESLSNIDSQLQDNSSTDDNLRPAQDKIPKQQVCYYVYIHTHTCSKFRNVFPLVWSGWHQPPPRSILFYHHSWLKCLSTLYLKCNHIFMYL